MGWLDKPLPGNHSCSAAVCGTAALEKTRDRRDDKRQSHSDNYV